MLKGNALFPRISQLAFLPNKELGGNRTQISLSMKYSPARDSKMTVVLSLCYEQSLDEVVNCSQCLAHMVGHIYSLGTAMACGELATSSFLRTIHI